MTRKFLDDVRAEIDVNFPDNTTGAITPALTRSTLHDIVDSTVSDEALIAGAPEVTGYALTTTFSALTTGLYSAEAGGDGSFLTTNIAAGNITTSPTAGFTYSVSAALTVQAANNEIVEMAIMVNGVASRFQPSITGRGTNDRPVSVYIEAFVNGADSTANSVIQICARMPDGAGTISIDDVILNVTIKPTNDPL